MGGWHCNCPSECEVFEAQQFIKLIKYYLLLELKFAYLCVAKITKICLPL